MNEQPPNLGILEYEYDTNQIGRYFGLIAGTSLIGIGLIGFLFALRETEKLIWIIMGLLFIFFSVIGIVLIKRFRDNQGGIVRLYAKGLDVTNNGKKYVALWKEFEWIKEIITENRVNGIHVSNNYLYIVKLKNGEVFSLDQTFFGVKDIGERLSAETLKLFYPQYLREIRNGGRVNFEEIGLDSKGLTVNGKTYLWSGIYGFTIEEGLIEVFPEFGKSIWQKAYADIQNPHVFVKLLEDFVKEFDGK
jgi:hypothetical protein